MTINQSLARIPPGDADRPAARTAREIDLDTRWDAWMARGRVHDRLVRRRFVVWGSVAATGAATVYAFFRS